MKESSPSSSLKSVGATVTSMSPAPEEAMRAGACESLPVEGGDEQDVGRSGTSSLIAVPSCRLLFLLSLPFSTPAGKRLPSLRSNSSLTMKFASEHGSQPLTAGRKATSFGARADSLAEGRWRWARPERNNDESANRASSETIKLFSSRMASEASESSSKTECSLIDGRELRFELVEKPERPEAEDALQNERGGAVAGLACRQKAGCSVAMHMRGVVSARTEWGAGEGRASRHADGSVRKC
eukprot:scaffold289732_cov35-Tisochrysis_lutea.AAC.2